MTLVALANALLGDPMVKRFHADPRVQATELLLQERVPRHTPTIQPRPLDEMRVVAPPPAMPMRRFRSPHTVVPHAQFLSNGNYVTIVTNAGGGSSFCRGLAVTKSRRDPTRDPGSQFVYLRDVRSGSVWSATYHPTAAEPDDYVVEFRAERATFRRHDDEISTQLDVAVSTEDDVEVRRVTVVNQSTRIREIDVTSYAEIVLAPPADDLAHPAFGKLFLETEYLADSAALLCHRRAAGSSGSGRVGGARPEPRRPAAGAGRMGDRSRTIPRPRPGHRQPGRARRPRAVGHDRHRARSRSSASASGSGWSRGRRCASRFATGIASDRETAEALAQKYRDPSAASRTFALAFTHAQSGLRHLGISNDEALLFERLASRVLFADGSLRAESGHDCVERARSGRSVAARHFRRSADPARARRRRRRRGARAPGPAGAGVLAPERAERRCRHPERGSLQLSGRDPRTAHGPARQRALADVETSIRRRLPPARRSDRQSGAHVDRGRRAGGPRRRPRRPPRPARQTASGPDQPASGVRGRCRRRSRPSRRPSTRRSRRRR